MNRYHSLDALRGMCALIVVLHHLPIYGHFYDLGIVRNGWLFVDFFFVLSGFVITHAYGQRLETVRERAVFALRRIGRLWPLHIAMLAALFAFDAAALVLFDNGFAAGRQLTQLPYHVLLLHGLGFHSIHQWNIPSWSISVEMFLYATFVVFTLAPVKFRSAIATALVAVAVAFWASMPESPFNNVARGIAGFMSGYLAYHLHRQHQLPGWTEVAASAVVVAFVSAGVAVYLAPVAFAFAVVAFAPERGQLSSILNRRAGLALGCLSYSIYLTHGPILTVLTAAYRVLSPPWPTLTTTADRSLYTDPDRWALDVLSLAIVGAVIVSSKLTFRFIEQPGRALFRHLEGKRITEESARHGDAAAASKIQNDVQAQGVAPDLIR